MRTYLIFGEIEGKLDVLCVECTKCARKGRYHVLRVYGRNGIMSKWLSDLKGDWPEARRTQPAQTLQLAVP
jgi:hypothetical protein